MLTTYKQVRQHPVFQALEASFYGSHLLTVIGTELTRANRTDEARQLFAEALAAAKSPEQVVGLMTKAAQDGDFEQVLKPWDTLEKMPPASGGNSHFR